MNRSLRLYALCTIALLLITGAAWAADPPASSGTTPAILACLDSGDISVLDAQAAMAIRGQEYKYVLVKILGLNALDGGAGVQWTWNRQAIVTALSADSIGAIRVRMRR